MHPAPSSACSRLAGPSPPDAATHKASHFQSGNSTGVIALFSMTRCLAAAIILTNARETFLAGPMRRRECIGLMGSAVAGWPLGASAQPAERIRRVGPDAADIFQRSASYVDRVLRGAKPKDLPVQAPTKFELVINMRTAKAIGLDVPSTLSARADEVIE